MKAKTERGGALDLEQEIKQQWRGGDREEVGLKERALRMRQAWQQPTELAHIDHQRARRRASQKSHVDRVRNMYTR